MVKCSKVARERNGSSGQELGRKTVFVSTGYSFVLLSMVSDILPHFFWKAKLGALKVYFV